MVYILISEVYAFTDRLAKRVWEKEVNQTRNTKLFSASRRNESIASDTSKFKDHASSQNISEIKRQQEEI